MDNVRPLKKLRLLSDMVSRRADIAAVLALFTITVIAGWSFLRGETVVGMDAATQFYPWYSFLGESLRSGEVPAWNPHQFSGTPFAANPLSGWTYLPAMLLFTLLPLVAAAKSYLLLTLLLAGYAAYALSRSLGMGVSGALLAAVAYEFSGYFYLQNTCCFAYTAVMAWFPVTLLGVEMAVRSSRWLDRGLWWGLSGLGLSQILAAWLGQGSYYALIALGGYVGYRTLIFPPDVIRGIRGRLVGSVMHGGAVLLIGFGLAAAGVLPRLEYNGLSNLAGGYPDEGGQAEGVGGWVAEDWGMLLEPGFYYASVAVLALALAAPFVARGRYAVPYLTVLALGALTLSGQGPTLLHSALYLLPRFEQLHPHSPERVLVVFYLAVALLAGATLSRVGELGRSAGSAALLPAAAGLFLLTRVESLPKLPVVVLILAVVLTAAYALLPARFASLRRLAPVFLILTVFVDLFVAGRAIVANEWLTEGGKSLDLAEYYQPSGAARFLESRDGGEPFRYFGFGLGPPGGTISSPTKAVMPEVTALEANNRAMMQGLQTTQGYDPVRLARYDDYVEAMDEDEQNSHHFADVFETGLDSPLLDLLNARYIIVPADPYDVPPADRPGLDTSARDTLQKLEENLPTVYEDDQTKVLENEEAMPRAWIVHSARRTESGEALELLNSGEVDPKETALLEDEPPEIYQAEDPSADRASVTEYGADRIELETTTDAPGLLVLSEVYYPAWKAYVDGSPVTVHLADGLLRSVPVPEGEHTVELRYESWTLRAGMAVSLLTAVGLTSLVATAVARRWGRTRKESGNKRAGKLTG